MKGLQIKNGKVSNIAVFGSDLPEGWVIAPEGVGIGWSANTDDTFTAPPAPPVLVTEQELRRKEMLAGVLFEEVMCSATSEDMWGLSAVKDWVKSGQAVPFKFDNGNTLQLSPVNIEDFESVWVPFRASFF